MRPRTPPNILWILTTQWRASALGYAGDPNARTPALEALASCSLNYRQAVTPHPFGPFARAALFTGRPCPDNGVRDYFDPLPPDTATIAHALGSRGYATAFFGKWHLAPKDPDVPLVGTAHARTLVPAENRGGFGFWEGFEGGFQLENPWLHGTRIPEPTCVRGYQSDVLAGRVADWLRGPNSEGPDGGQPWFAVLSLEAPHPPYRAAVPDGIPERDPDALILAPNVPRGGDVESRARRELAGYYRHIEATDSAIGRLLKAVPEETIIVFTSVHGDMHGAHGLFRKGWPHEESIRVPLLVRGAPGADAGTRRDPTAASSDDPVSLLDLPEMTLAWADGRSWTCGRDRAEISMPSVVRLPDQCDRTWRGWRSPLEKRIDGPAGLPWIHINLGEDPYELHNLVEGAKKKSPQQGAKGA